MKGATAYAIAWIATAFAVSVGIYLTKNASCLWTMLIPACVSYKSGSDEDKREEK